MSYLNPLRLHFAGTFQAAIPTLNNTAQNFDNDFQGTPDLGFNPTGSGSWRLIGCRVTTAWLADGSRAGEDDAINQCLIADSDRQAPAKLVDLDTMQQFVSEIWGLEVRICDPNGVTLLRGKFEPACFMDLWRRAPGGGDGAASAMYQSVLTGLEWGDTSGSPFLQQLQAAATEGLLSIKFNVDGYSMDRTSSNFTYGRIVGTIGPATSGEPRHFVLGRQFLARRAGSNITFCAAVVNEARRKIYLDLGNALPAASAGGPPANLGILSFGYQMQEGDPAPARILQDSIPYREPGWYENTAGVVELPLDRELTDDELNEIASARLALWQPQQDGSLRVRIEEGPRGLYVRADQSVYRLNPGEQARVRLYATRFGQPHGGARVVAFHDKSELQDADLEGGIRFDPGHPLEALEFADELETQPDGTATLTITAGDPGNPRSVNGRQVIDGQVYGVRPMLQETMDIPNYPANPDAFISLLVWSAFQPDEPPTWQGTFRPIFEQYGNLYPVMDQIVNLKSYESICENRELLLLAFGLPIDNPNAMPVTRDLSAAKRQAIIRWLTETDQDGNPLEGDEAVVAAPAVEAVAFEAAPERESEVAVLGGKTSAARRRVGARTG